MLKPTRKKLQPSSGKKKIPNERKGINQTPHPNIHLVEKYENFSEFSINATIIIHF